MESDALLTLPRWLWPHNLELKLEGGSMVVDAKIWVWTKHRMVLMQDGPAFSTGYIERSEAERLLEEAHKRGYQQCQLEHRKVGEL